MVSSHAVFQLKFYRAFLVFSCMLHILPILSLITNFNEPQRKNGSEIIELQ